MELFENSENYRLTFDTIGWLETKKRISYSEMTRHFKITKFPLFTKKGIPLFVFACRMGNPEFFVCALKQFARNVLQDENTREYADVTYPLLYGFKLVTDDGKNLIDCINKEKDKALYKDFLRVTASRDLDSNDDDDDDEEDEITISSEEEEEDVSDSDSDSECMMTTKKARHKNHKEKKITYISSDSEPENPIKKKIHYSDSEEEELFNFDLSKIKKQ